MEGLSSPELLLGDGINCLLHEELRLSRSQLLNEIPHFIVMLGSGSIESFLERFDQLQ